MNNTLSSAQQPPPALPSKSQPNTIESKKKLKHATLGGKQELAKPDSVVKTRSPSLIKNGKLQSTLVNGKGSPDVDKSNAATNKSKNLPDVSLNNHVEDVSRGYLKLLFLTAASGTNGHVIGTFQ